MHPIAITAGILLVVNDHWLKQAWPGAVTGKLSDFAGLIIFPLLLASLAEFLRLLTRRPIVATGDDLRWTLVSGLGFVFVKSTEVGNAAYAWSVGAVRWPYHAFTAVVGGDSAPQIQPIDVSRDLTDLIALVVLPLPYILIRARHYHSLKGLNQVSDNQAIGGRPSVKETPNAFD